jgi:hypothetical protein
VSVEILPGGKIFEGQLDLMKRRVVNFAPAFAVIDTLMLAYETRRFEQEGPGWIPLAAATITRKASMPYQQILQRGEPGHTEGLKQSLTTHGPGSLFQVTPLTLTMGTSVSYAHYHQTGDGVPKRRPFPSGTDLLPSYLVWRAVLEAYLVGGEVAARTIGATASQ